MNDTGDSRGMPDRSSSRISRQVLNVCAAFFVTLLAAATSFAFDDFYVSVRDIDNDGIVFESPVAGPPNSHVLVIDKEDNTFKYTEIRNDGRKRVSRVPPVHVLKGYPDLIETGFKRQWSLAKKDVTDSQYRKTVKQGAGDKESVKRAVVTVATRTGWGTGFLISRTGYVVTNAHVMSVNDNIVVIFSDGEQKVARLIKIDDIEDLALLKIDGEDVNYLSLGDSNKCSMGDRVTAIGSPGGPKLTHLEGKIIAGMVTEGSITEIHKKFRDRNYSFIQSSTYTDHGSSGGPLLNDRMQVIGINSGGKDLILIGSSGKKLNLGAFWYGVLHLHFTGKVPEDASLAIPVNNLKKFIAVR